MEGSSKFSLSPSAKVEDYEYLYASNTNVSNFVSVKLSGNRNYFLWKAQMLCLLDSHNMCGIIDSTFVGPRQYDSLVKGWIFGSVREDVLVDIYNLDSAKGVWDTLKSIYDPTVSLQQADLSLKTTAVAQIETKNDTDPAETNTTSEGAISIKIQGNIDSDSAEIYDLAPTKSDAQTETKDMAADPAETNTTNEDTISIKKYRKWVLHVHTIKGNWSEVESILKKDKDLATEAITIDGSTILHIAVGVGHNDFLNNFLRLYINEEQVLKKRNSDGSTALHIAAIVGNKNAAELLVKKNTQLLLIQDNKGEQPLHKACENMHLDTTAYLLKHITTNHPLPGDIKIGVELLANAISAKEYSLAFELVDKHPDFASNNDHVLMAIAKTFPPELNRMESLVYPSLDEIWSSIRSWAELLKEIWIVIPQTYLDDWSYGSVTGRIRRTFYSVIITVKGTKIG